MKETEIGIAVAEEFRREGWEVFGEVSTGQGQPVCDMVARRGSLLWAIECKTTRSLDVLDQAMWWTQCAHLVSVAVPGKRRKRLHRYDGWAELAAHRGIGVFGVDLAGRGKPLEVAQLTFPAVRRRIRLPYLSKGLVDAQRLSVPGTSGGGRWTPFRNTCDQLRKIVAEHPGIPLREAVAKISHHYARNAVARSALAKWIHAGTVVGLRMDSGKLHPTTEQLPSS